MDKDLLRNENIQKCFQELIGCIAAKVSSTTTTTDELSNKADLEQVKNKIQYSDTLSSNSFSSGYCTHASNELRSTNSVAQDDNALQNLKLELQELKKTVELSTLETENLRNTVIELQTSTTTLNTENQQLKAKIAAKIENIVNVQENIDKIKEEHLSFHELLTKIICNTQNKLDDVECLEKSTSQFLIENFELKQMQQKNIDEILQLKKSLNNAEKLICLTLADVEQLKEMSLEKKIKHNVCLKHCPINSERVICCGKLRLLKEEVRQVKAVCTSRSEVTFIYTVQNINQLKSSLLSPAVYVHMIPWKILIQRCNGKLGIFLRCNEEDKSTTWSCTATTMINLKSCKQDADISHGFNRYLFNTTQNSWGYPGFVTFTKLFDPKNSYVCNNSITIEVYLKADEPQGATIHPIL